MKKLLIYILTLTMMVTFVACGKEDKPAQDSDNPAVQDGEDDNGNKEQGEEPDEEGPEKPLEEESENENSLLSGTYNAPMQDIYVDVPNWQEIEQAYTELFIIHDSKYVAFTGAYSDVAEDAKDAHDKAFKEFIVNMQNYEGGVNSINITKEETTTINGLEVYSFEGTINYGVENIYEGYAKGYSFIMDGVPCEIIGSVTEDSQSAELIDEISEVVDQMMNSVRSEQ